MYAKMLIEVIYGDNDNSASWYFLSLHPYISCTTLLCQEKSPIDLLKKINEHISGDKETRSRLRKTKITARFLFVLSCD